MVGVGELNINGEGTFSESATSDPNKLLLGRRGVAYQRLVAIALAVKESGGGTVSMHLANTFDPKSPSEIEALLEVAEKFPTVKFIICHSGLFHEDGKKSFGLDGLKKIGQYYRENPKAVQNVWTDLSGFLGDMSAKSAYANDCELLKRQEELASAWRNFGIDRVMFGSDDEVGDGNPVEPVSE